MNIQPGTLPPNAGPILAVIAGIILLILLRGRLGRSLLLGLQRVQEVCAILVHKGLHLDQLLEQRKDVSTVTASLASSALAETTDDGEQPSQPAEQQEKMGSEVFMIAVRLLGLLFTLDVLLALLILDGIRTGIVVFQNEASAGLVKLPISIPTVMGLLGWSMIVLMGSFLMEVVMKRWPAGLEFLPPFWREGRASRILFRWLIGAGNVILFTYVLLLGLVAQLQLYHVQWPAAGVIVAALQMVLANLVGLFALWIVLLGLGALFSTICLIIQVACSILLLLLRAWVKPGKVLVGMVAQGGAIVPGAVTGGSGGAGSLGGSPDQMWGESGHWEKESRSTVGTGIDDDREMPKAKVAKYQSSIVSTGASGLRLLTTTLDDPWTLSGLKGAVRSMGYTPTKRPPDRSVGQKIRQRGSIDISNSPGEVQIARQQPGNEISLLLNQQRLKLQQHTPKTAGYELMLWAMDWQQVNSAVEPITRLHQAEPRQVIVPVVEVPVSELDDPDVRAMLEKLESLWQQHIVTTSILTDRQVATVRVVRKTQTLYQAHSLNGVLVSHLHHDENPTGADLFTLLGKKTPFVSLAAGSIPLTPGGKLSAFDAGRWTVGSTRGRGNAEDARLSMESLGQMLLDDEASRLFPARVDLTRAPLCGEVFVPFPQDRRFQALCEGLELWAADTIPGATMMFIAGPGVKDDTAMGAVDVHYVGQWTWLFGFGMDEVLGISDAQPAEEPVEEPEAPVRRTTNNARPRAKANPVPTPTPAAKSPARGQGSARPQPEAKPGKRGRRTPLRAVELPKNDDQSDDPDDAWVL